jgi:methylmalonyl-CoA/ethylmalonyl-CoA epimerase
MVPDGRLHHVGYVVKSIEECAAGFARSLNTTWDRTIHSDPHQSAKVTFLYPGMPGNPAIELVEPQGEAGPVTRFLQRGGGLHHVCYEVDDFESTVRSCTGPEARVVRAPAPAVAFGQRQIAWVYTRYGLLVELLDRCGGAPIEATSSATGASAKCE